MPDMLVHPECRDVLEPGLVGGEPHQLGFDRTPHRLPRRAQLPGEAVHGRVFATQLTDRPRGCALRDRTPRSDHRWELLHERLLAARIVGAPPDPLPPHDPHPRHAGHVVQDPSASSAAHGDHAARRAFGRGGRAGYRHD